MRDVRDMRDMTQTLDIVIAGVGGQGTVLASKLLANAALVEGRMVRTAETIGMAQRGGSVLGHVRVTRAHGSSADAPLSPLVPPATANLLIGFEPAETVRALNLVRHGGTVVTARQSIEPVTATLSNQSYDGSAELAYLQARKASGRLDTLVVVDGAAICATLASTRVLNVVLLGAALGTGAIDLSAASLTRAIETLVKPEFVELNQTALAQGMQLTERYDQ
jgi:indolepyruvate ferredoxin oxidoreductase beta subunit